MARVSAVAEGLPAMAEDWWGVAATVVTGGVTVRSTAGPKRI